MQGIKGIGIALILALLASPAFSAQDPAVLLEKAIYAEETLGKLNDAIALYKQIISDAEATRVQAAQALYRLGMCYRKQGSETDALSTFSNLAKLYPEQKELIAKSLYLHLKPAPWADGEVMRLAYNGSGVFGTYISESGQEAGKPVWNLRYLFGGGQSPSHYSGTEADDVTMLPLKSWVRSNQTSLEAKYGADSVEVVNLKDSSQPPRQIRLEGAAYDAWQIVPILRRLPLNEGFQATVPLLEASTATSANVRFSVTGRETITVPAGTFDCYKVVMVSDDSLPTDQRFWISTDSHAYLAKAHLNRTDEFVLHSIEVVEKNRPAMIEIPGTALAFSVPHQWYLSTVSGFPTYDAGVFLGIAAPEVDSDLGVTVFKIDSTLAAQIAQPTESKLVHKVVVNGIEQSYEISYESQEKVSFAGLTGKRYISKTLNAKTGEEIVACVYRLASETKSYSFSFRTAKDNLDKMRPVFESIMTSLKAK